MISFEKLDAKITALTGVIANVKDDYAGMLAQIAELKVFVDGSGAQAKVDELEAKVTAALDSLSVADAEFPVVPA